MPCSPSGGLPQQKPQAAFQVISVMNAGKIKKNGDWPSKLHLDSKCRENCWSQLIPGLQCGTPDRDPEPANPTPNLGLQGFDIGEMRLHPFQNHHTFWFRRWPGFQTPVDHPQSSGSASVAGIPADLQRDDHYRQLGRRHKLVTKGTTLAQHAEQPEWVSTSMIPLNMLLYLHPSVSSRRSKNPKMIFSVVRDAQFKSGLFRSLCCMTSWPGREHIQSAQLSTFRASSKKHAGPAGSRAARRSWSPAPLSTEPKRLRAEPGWDVEVQRSSWEGS